MDSERESKILVKSPKQRNKAQRKIDYKNYDTITMSEIITRNYQLVNYQEKLSASILCRGKCGNYRNTGVSKNHPSLVYYRGQILEKTWNCTHILKNVINLFVCIKLFFFTISFLCLFYSLVGYNVYNPPPGDQEPNFKKVGPILCGRNTK